MDDKLKEDFQLLQSFVSGDAADWMIENYTVVPDFLSKLHLEEDDFLKVTNFFHLLTLDSADAVNWMIENYTVVPAFLPKLSLNKDECIKISKYFLQNRASYGSDFWYRIYLEILSVKDFISIIEKHIYEMDLSHFQLFMYCINPTIYDYIESDEELLIFQNFENRVISYFKRTSLLS